MSLRDKTIKGVPYGEFRKVDKAGDGMYTLEKIDGTSIKIKLAKNEAGALKNHIRARKMKSTPENEAIDLDASTRIKLDLDDNVTIEEAIRSQKNWSELNPFQDDNLRWAWVTLKYVTEKLSTGLWQLAKQEHVHPNYRHFYEWKGNPGDGMTAGGYYQRNELILLITSTILFEKYQKLNSSYSTSRGFERNKGYKKEGNVITVQQGNVY